MEKERESNSGAIRYNLRACFNSQARVGPSSSLFWRESNCVNIEQQQQPNDCSLRAAEFCGREKRKFFRFKVLLRRTRSAANNKWSAAGRGVEMLPESFRVEPFKRRNTLAILEPQFHCALPTSKSFSSVRSIILPFRQRENGAAEFACFHNAPNSPILLSAPLLSGDDAATAAAAEDSPPAAFYCAPARAAIFFAAPTAKNQSLSRPICLSNGDKYFQAEGASAGHARLAARPSRSSVAAEMQTRRTRGEEEEGGGGGEAAELAKQNAPKSRRRRRRRRRVIKASETKMQLNVWPQLEKSFLSNYTFRLPVSTQLGSTSARRVCL